MSEPEAPSTAAPAVDPPPVAVSAEPAAAVPSVPQAASAAAQMAPVAPRPRPSRRRFVLWYVLPAMLALGWIALPLVRGTKTLYMRDVLNAHLAMKWSEARALRQGYFPLVDPYRGGGEPLAGNPNAAPFYPTTLLFLWSSPFWALNAHFWIHLLLAPFAFYWMARRFGLAREAAWAAAVCYAGCGFYLSHLSFYNLIAGATLTPALVAACLAVSEDAGGAAGGLGDRRGGRWRALHLPAVAVLWALVMVGGDPLTVAMGGALALAALGLTWNRWAWLPTADELAAAVHAVEVPAVEATAVEVPAGEVAPVEAAAVEATAPAVAPAAVPARRRRRFAWRVVGELAAAVACGTLLALPQIEEFLRILPVSFRGVRGYTAGVAPIASWRPLQAAEWLLPTLFGRLDVRHGGTFWGAPYFTGAPPLFPSLYPGLLALALLAAAGRPRGRAAWWAWGSAAAGIFCSLGRYNPVMQWLFERAGGGAMRYPVKFWLPVAVGLSLLCGLGFEQLVTVAAVDAWGRAGRRFRRALGVLTLVLGGAWIFLSFAPGPAVGVLRRIVPAERPLPFVANERLRWAGLCLFSLIILFTLQLVARRMTLSARAAWGAGAVLLGVHAVSQVFLLRPLYPTDAVAPYRVPPPALAWLPAGTVAVNPDFEHLFGQPTFGAGKFPSDELLWLERRAFSELFPFAGPLWDRRFDLNESPEGLDSYYLRLLQGALPTATDEQRMRLLAAWGVGRVFMERPLAPTSHARLLAALPSFGQTLHVYEVLGRSPEVFLARRVWLAPHMTAAYDVVKVPPFEPQTDVVMPGKGGSYPSAGGTVRVLRRGPESLDLDLDVGPGGSVLVVQRAQLIYRAAIDGRRAPLLVANLFRNGLAVPAGRHQVRLWVDRTNFHRAVAATVAGLAVLPLLGVWAAGAGRARRRRSSW
jgi:hypothetical protein